MHRRPRLTTARGAGPALLGLLFLAGCGAGTVATAPAPHATAAACAQVAAHWPATVGGAERRPTSTSGLGTQGATAAWGDPAVIARCGMPQLAPTTDPCIEVDGIGWVTQDITDGVRLTTFGTNPALEVLVPSSYGAGPLLLPAFDEAARALPGNGLKCR